MEKVSLYGVVKVEELGTRDMGDATTRVVSAIAALGDQEAAGRTVLEEAFPGASSVPGKGPYVARRAFRLLDDGTGEQWGWIEISWTRDGELVVAFAPYGVGSSSAA